MTGMFKIATRMAAVAACAVSLQANATLILNQSVTSTFVPFATSTGTGGNDLPGAPNSLYFGQLAATQNGYVDFFYIGNEAAYTNTLVVNDNLNDGLATQTHSSAGLVDNFAPPYAQVATSLATAGSFIDFGFCTDGGANVGAYGKCAANDVAASLTAQYNYTGVGGYRSIGFRALSAFDPAAGLYTFGAMAPSNLWMVFWDDSGAKNDDNHDDYIAVLRFRPIAVSEPSTMLLLGAAFLGFGLLRRRKFQA